MYLDQFIDQYRTDVQCEDAIEAARWGHGFCCPKCGGTDYSTFHRKGLKYWQYAAHKHQITLRTETLFHSSRLPLRKWLLAIFLISQSKTDIFGFITQTTPGR